MVPLYLFILFQMKKYMIVLNETSIVIWKINKILLNVDNLLLRCLIRKYICLCHDQFILRYC